MGAGGRESHSVGLEATAKAQGSTGWAGLAGAARIKWSELVVDALSQVLKMQPRGEKPKSRNPERAQDRGAGDSRHRHSLPASETHQHLVPGRRCLAIPERSK